MSSEAQYSSLSIKLTKLLPKKVKKDQGIFITPLCLIRKLYLRIKQFKDEVGLEEFSRVLEPSCGTCEMISYLDTVLYGASIFGVEQNPILYDHIKELSSTFVNNTVTLKEGDFIMEPTNGEPYDLIFGNPPYFVCKKEQVPVQYREYTSGRPNIFGTFILHSLALLKVGGILGFIVPKSFLNSGYYMKIRNFIKETCSIVDILDFESNDEFLETQQATMGLILHKKGTMTTAPKECAYSLKLGNHFVFSSNSLQLKNLLLGSTTLSKMGLRVKTGSIVWNECKDELTSDSSKGILLLYNSNINTQNEIELKDFVNNEEKHQYIMKSGSCDPVLVVNRGNGNSAYKLSWSIVDGETEYLVENHLNVIYSPTFVERKILLKVYSTISKSFKDPRTKQFIKLYLGNNGLSKTELESIFPIYL
jgi:Eco57I restriction-modification methylase